MCFSATASFTLGALLIATGTLTVSRAAIANRNYLFFALIPIFFGIQQGVEGIIWLQLQSKSLHSELFYSKIYLFFAYAFWPFYIPLSVYFIEREPLRKKILSILIIIGVVLGIILYAPVVFTPDKVMVSVVYHSIRYEVYSWKLFFWVYPVCYLLVTVFSPLISSERKINLAGILIFLGAVISYWWYVYAFESVWCFFAAAISFYVAYVIYSLPQVNK